jgi:hypothetical protein
MVTYRWSVFCFAFLLVLFFPSASTYARSVQGDPLNEVLIQETLFNLPLGYTLTEGVLDLCHLTARSTDFILLNPQEYNLAGQVSRGHLMCLVPQNSLPFDIPSKVPARCEYLLLQDDIPEEAAQSLRLMADVYHKKVALSPEAGLALADDALLITHIAPYAHLLIIQAGRWLAEDTSPALDTFLSKVHTVAAAARAANPGIFLQLQLEYPILNKGLTIDRLHLALSRLAEAYPGDLQSCFISRVDAWDDPEQGNNLLVQALTFLRGEAYAPPGAPPTPLNFQATALGPTEVLLSWTDVSADETGYLLMRGQAPDRPPARVSELPPFPDLVSHQDGVPAAGAYYYWLCAFNANGLSLFSPVEAVETGVGKANLPPRILSRPQTTAYRGVPFEYAVSAADPDGDALDYSLSVHPAGMLIDSKTGLITWLPAAFGRYLVSLTVADGQAAGFQWFEVEVKEAER